MNNEPGPRWVQPVATGNSSPNPRCSTGVSLITVAVAIATLTLFPFHALIREPGATGGNVVLGLALGPLYAFDVAQNALLFIPFGAALAGCVRFRSRQRIVLTAGGCAIVFSFLCESAQRVLPTRDPSWVDVISNTAGAVLGAGMAARWPVPVVGTETFLRRVVRLHWSGWQTAIAVVVALLCVGGLGITAHQRALLSNWDGRYPLMVATAGAGTRLWHGSISQLEIVPYAVTDETARRLSGSTGERLEHDRVAQTDFWSSATNRASRVFDSAVGSGFRNSTGSEWLQSSAATTELSEAIGRSSQFTIHLVCFPAPSGQNGVSSYFYPVEIASIGISSHHRNVSVAENVAPHEDMLVARVRNQFTGESGELPELRVSGVFQRDRTSNIILVYDRDSLKIFVGGKRFPESLKFSAASGLAWDSDTTLGQETLHGAQTLYFAAVMLVCVWLVPVVAPWLRLVAGGCLGFALLHLESRIAIGRLLTMHDSIVDVVVFLVICVAVWAARFLSQSVSESSPAINNASTRAL